MYKRENKYNQIYIHLSYCHLYYKSYEWDFTPNRVDETWRKKKKERYKNWDELF